MSLTAKTRNRLIIGAVGAVALAAIALSPGPNSERQTSISSVSPEGPVSPIIRDDTVSESAGAETSGHSNAIVMSSSAVIQVGFSPGSGATTTVLNIINGAESEIRLAGYSFTSPAVVRGLIEAKKRGVDVKVVVDKKGNATNSASRQALNFLSVNGIPVKLNGNYAIHHDKFIVADRVHVQTGSYNYSKSAETRNSENVIAVWNVPKLAEKYLRHWESRYSEGTLWKSDY